ncbi:hypothetical protein Tco_0318284 [Tanacetum coccineum]
MRTRINISRRLKYASRRTLVYNRRKSHKNHPLRFSIGASLSVPWIYFGQLWHTLKEDGSNYRLSFMLDKKELTLTLDDFRTIFQLPQATDNNHKRFVVAPKFPEMVPFFLNDLGFTMELRSPSNLKTTGLIMQMLYCFVNNVHVDYADLLWEGLHYSLEHPSTLIPYPIFTKLIMSHYMVAFPEISRRVRDKYHNLEDDEMVKIIFNSRKNKAGVGVKILIWMITDEMKLTEHYRMTTSAPRSPKPDVNEGDSSAPRKSTIIRLHIPPRRSTRLTPLTPIPTTDEADDIILQDTIQLSFAEQKSCDELEANKMLEPRSNKESPKVEITIEVQPVNTIKEEEESAEDDYELRRREKGTNVEESRHTPSPTTIRSLRIHFNLKSLDTGKLQELTVNDQPHSSSTPSSSSSKLSAINHILSLFKPKTVRFKRYKSFFDELQGRYGYLFEHLKTRFMPRKKFHVLSQHLQEVMEESLPKMSQVDVAKMIADAIHQECENLQAQISSQINNVITIPSRVDSSIRNYMSSNISHVYPTQASQASAHEQQYQLYLTMKDNPQLQHDNLPIWLALKIKFKGLQASNTPCRPSVVRPRDQEDHHDDAHPEGKNSTKRKKSSEHVTFVIGESSSGQINESEPSPSTSLIQSCQRDPKAPALSLVNQDLLYLKKGNSRSEKIVLSLHKFPAVIFPDDDIEERTSRWVDKCVKKFNPYARYCTYGELGHEHKFITEIIARRVNGSVVSITEPDYKNLNKNDIEDMYLLIVNGKLGVESYQSKVNLTAPTITFLGIKKYKVFFIVFEPVYGIIYKNVKKEKRVMRHQEIYKFCDATLNRVLEGLKSYNNNVKHGYVTPSLSKEDVEYVQLFEEEIEEQLKHHDQMRGWEMYVNGRPLGSRRNAQNN